MLSALVGSFIALFELLLSNCAVSCERMWNGVAKVNGCCAFPPESLSPPRVISVAACVLSPLRAAAFDGSSPSIGSVRLVPHKKGELFSEGRINKTRMIMIAHEGRTHAPLGSELRTKWANVVA